MVTRSTSSESPVVSSIAPARELNGVAGPRFDQRGLQRLLGAAAGANAPCARFRGAGHDKSRERGGDKPHGHPPSTWTVGAKLRRRVAACKAAASWGEVSAAGAASWVRFPRERERSQPMLVRQLRPLPRVPWPGQARNNSLNCRPVGAHHTHRVTAKVRPACYCRSPGSTTLANKSPHIADNARVTGGHHSAEH